jgi:hypothetical protein
MIHLLLGGEGRAEGECLNHFFPVQFNPPPIRLPEPF